MASQGKEFFEVLQNFCAKKLQKNFSSKTFKIQSACRKVLWVGLRQMQSGLSKLSRRAQYRGLIDLTAIQILVTEVGKKG